ncbi:uncharacterized protein LOC131667860 [Phymastichus coffea]|uniref:uncharacterized protein LOC131667860 n=1 Tax=Phymastichus coffea TaxID=108790 RepID=UPI00273B0CF7|nr:uncharacterized protein LOC131667860 [Phymastichus coffea]XP_058797581.1 uncharacterized protein LOC131667860 [Phymastichus coffea]XP_058797582.1 uncharacterized protein LOC131667860 [Phymastichus coffea]XP_058797583.1 uncharacterized protein LOC131667860 [Phymastichus coffea]
MHLDTNTPCKEMVELNMTVASEQQISFLEEDLALSSSAHDSLVERTITEAEEKTHDETTCQSPAAVDKPPAPIYVSEDAMDCNYDESSSNLSKHFELPEEQSPELFESDADDEAESTTSTFPIVAISQEPSQPTQPSPKKLTPAELILKADRYIRRRVHKFLSGVPPPPNHTISQRDCDDFLAEIKRNRSYFWADPFEGEISKEANVSTSSETSTYSKAESSTNMSTDEKKIFHPPKGSLRNLSTAFDACEQLSNSRHDNNESLMNFPDNGNSFSSLLNNSSFLSVSTLALNEESKLGDSGIQEQPPMSYMSMNVNEVTKLPFKDAFAHRCHDIYYNRNRFVEDFENLRVKLCDRYIGNETQSTCNVWFVKQAPNSVRKRGLLHKRNNGQSPSKRLSHLARRRRTFSSANLQGLGVAEKKLVTISVRKYTGIMTRKGKSPRGKSPRGKSPRSKTTPRSSTKKRQIRNGTPRKRVEFPKRALFQSPPTDKPGPSRLSTPTTVTSNNPSKIKKALFPTPKKNEAADSSQSLSYPDSRKRKSDEELENPRLKWPKSLSFDCTQNLESSSNKWNSTRLPMGTVLSKDGTPNYGKSELSETHRKKLLWAVSQALRSKGIGMSHPQFKQYATALGRTVRKYMPDLENKNAPKKPGSTTDRMLKLAKRYVIVIVESKTAH